MNQDIKRHPPKNIRSCLGAAIFQITAARNRRIELIAFTACLHTVPALNQTSRLGNIERFDKHVT
ncbi:hypothetical protein [Agrobacterium larrymoorei]|uniref:Uncharacterized protein n=1 Tax=Agrobacterium larrymoorei TaxID=160699 RepID=A0A4D7E1A6_9HYPH|nr:hypothetical protein [Agrobacterium larrymoorei]QCJ01070.1 hypothetical protein CFBP5473_24280 [Agrobacterium larrymoorei]QYA10087.1 hypothetical protein J5285_22935 [Agrobacterium larrymoorei]